MKRPFGMLRGQSERTVMLGAVLILSALSVATGYLLIQIYSANLLASLLWVREDCLLDWGMNIGSHCFSDYGMIVGAGLRPNPWEPYGAFPPDYQPLLNRYPAAGMIPQLLFGLPAEWLGAPRLGLVGYLLALTIAVLSPAIWAARGARGLERVVVFVALGAAAIPVWTVIDRGNSAGFIVPIALAFLVALRRQRWGLVAVMVILAALVKPQFAVLAVALLAARQWRLGALAFVGVALSNIAAYLLWPQDFPETIAQWIHNLSSADSGATDVKNVSFSRPFLLLPDLVKGAQTGGKIPDDFLAGPRSLIGFAILLVVTVAVIGLGRCIPPIMAGIAVLTTATLFPPVAMHYYLVFVLPIAAVLVRDPDGPPGTGIFDRIAAESGARRKVGICISLAVAVSIAQIAIPGQPVELPIYGQMGARGEVGTTPVVLTTVLLTPILWLVACAAIIVSYARKPVLSLGTVQEPANEGPLDSADTVASDRRPTLSTESSPQRLA